MYNDYYIQLSFPTFIDQIPKNIMNKLFQIQLSYFLWFIKAVSSQLVEDLGKLVIYLYLGVKLIKTTISVYCRNL